MTEENRDEKPQNAHGRLTEEAVETRAGSGGTAARPLSQFILAKRADGLPARNGFSANIEPIRPVVMAAPIRQTGTSNASGGHSARHHSPMRVEYPFYEEGEDDLNLNDFPALADTPSAEPARPAVQTEPAAAPKNEGSEPAAAQPGSGQAVPVREIPAAAAPLSSSFSSDSAFLPNALHIYAARVPDAETALPLLCDRGKADPLPIFRCYLAAELSR